MEPTFQVGDRIMVNKLSYDFHGVRRGDIVVFKRPPLEQQDVPDLVKRVVGLPGESVSTQKRARVRQRETLVGAVVAAGTVELHRSAP